MAGYRFEVSPGEEWYEFPGFIGKEIYSGMIIGRLWKSGSVHGAGTYITKQKVTFSMELR